MQDGRALFLIDDAPRLAYGARRSVDGMTRVHGPRVRTAVHGVVVDRQAEQMPA